jgi:iron complex outermembrane receptor protein
MPSINHYNNYRLGADYDLTANTLIGFVVSGYSTAEKTLMIIRTIIGKQFGVGRFITEHTYRISLKPIKTLPLTLTTGYKIDTSGQELSIDLDYSKFKNNSNAML